MKKQIVFRKKKKDILATLKSTYLTTKARKHEDTLSF